MDELERLGRPGAYRLGDLGAQGAEPAPPKRFRPSFARASRRGPASAWVLGFAAGVAAMAAGIAVGIGAGIGAGVIFAPFLAGLLAGLVMRWGGWRPRAVLTAAAVMGAAGWGIPLGWQALHAGPPGAPGHVVAGWPGTAGLPAHGTRGVAVALLAGGLQALVAAGLGSVLAARAAARGRVADVGEPGGPADAGDLVRLLGPAAGGAPPDPAGGRGHERTAGHLHRRRRETRPTGHTSIVNATITRAHGRFKRSRGETRAYSGFRS